MLGARRPIRNQIVRRLIMKSNYMAPVACAALLFGFAIANAQTSPTSTAGAASTPTQAGTTNGNDLVDTSQAVPQNPTDNPRSDGENKADGNDLVSPNKSGMQQAMATRPAFDTLDTKKHGSLTADDVKGNKWLSTNFAKCDTDHDGQLSRQEYANCHH
jgi:hypothetical protein